MTTNLVRDGESFRWQLDFDAMERLLRDFFATEHVGRDRVAGPQHESTS